MKTNYLFPFVLTITWTNNLHLVQAGQDDTVNIFDHALESQTQQTSSVYHKLKESVKKTLRGFSKCNPPPLQPGFACVESITSTYNWTQFGNDIDGVVEDGFLGLSVSMDEGGTRVAMGGKSILMLYDSFVRDFSGTRGWEVSGNLGRFFANYVVSVSLSGDGKHIIAGEQSQMTRSSANIGTVIVFQNNEDLSWTQVGNTLTGQSNDDGFGRSVDISNDGSVIAIGAPYGKYASIYNLEDFTWNLKFKQGSGNFGWSISLASKLNRVAMGAPNEDTSSAGSVYIYNLENNDLIQKIDGSTAGDKFGKSLSMSKNGDRLVVGAPDADYVKIYDMSQEDLTYNELPISLEALSGIKFGSSVSMSGDGNIVAVGSPGSDDGGNNVGKTFLYFVGCTSYKEIGSITGEAATDESGYAVAVNGSGNRTALGAFNNEGMFAGVGGAFNAGHVRVFEATISE